MGDGGRGSRADGEVEVGEAGIAGLARALGTAGDRGDKRERQIDDDKEEKKKRKEKKAPVDAREEGLRAVLNKRKAPLPTGGALKLKGDDLKKKKKKKRKRDSEKKRKSKKEEASKGSSEESDSGDDETSSSSSGSLFQLAALPQGVDRLHRLHQEKPGALADLTLRRFQELLNRSIGGGTAETEQEMPPVARAYLSQIYMVRHPEAAIGLRNLRELRTLATLVDLMAMNDSLRALDVAVQRMKSIELFIAQGQWSQANLLELIVPEEEQRAWFRQELKAAQQEHKSDLRLQRDQWPKRRAAWYPSPGGGGEHGQEGSGRKRRRTTRKRRRSEPRERKERKRKREEGQAVVSPPAAGGG